MSNDFLRFRRMIAPIVIEVLFWVTVVGIEIAGFTVLFGLGDTAAVGAGESRLAGLAMIFLGPIAARVYAEILIVIFRINETLTDIRNRMDGTGAPELG